MAMVWMVDCRICALRFAVLPREATPGKSTDTLEPGKDVGRHECPHCHEFESYLTDDLIPGEGRIMESRAEE
jgi:hypothetical protein